MNPELHNETNEGADAYRDAEPAKADCNQRQEVFQVDHPLTLTSSSSVIRRPPQGRRFSLMETLV